LIRFGALAVAAVGGGVALATVVTCSSLTNFEVPYGLPPDCGPSTYACPLDSGPDSEADARSDATPDAASDDVFHDSDAGDATPDAASNVSTPGDAGDGS
jgi:hypothetical protein